MRVEQSLIQQARQTDLPTFLMARGEQLKKVGKRYQFMDHDSLFVTGNMFFWNSRNLKGNTLSFVMEYYSMSFDEAIKELVGWVRGADVFAPPAHTITKEDTPFKLDEGTDMRRVFAYLHKTRGIDYAIIQRCVDDKIISIDSMNNIVFKWYDEQYNFIGAELCGTLTDKRFKGIATGSRASYGFAVKLGEVEVATKLLFFESGIDLLSFWDLHKGKLNTHILVSMGGLKEATIHKFSKIFSIGYENIYCCTDNDSLNENNQRPGRDFAEQIKLRYGTKTYHPKGFKDWNEVLVSLKNLQDKEKK